MGLDMHIFKISKLTNAEIKRLTNKNVQDFPNNITYFRKKEIEENDADRLFAQIKPYMSEINAVVSLIDIEKIKKDYQIPEDAYISGQHYTKDSTGFSFRNSRGFHTQVEFSDNEIDTKYLLHKTESLYVCHKKEVAYWRKHYDLSTYISEMMETPVENTGYYPLTDEQIEEICDYQRDYPREYERYQPIPYPANDNEAIVYWEWY